MEKPSLWAQRDTTPILQEVISLAKDRLVSIQTQDIYTERQGANQSTNNLANLLQSTTTAFVKTYSFSGLSTLSIRGTSASHTQVLWNGMKINSPMNGVVDISLIPLFLIEQVRIQYGVSNTLQASSALGGVINLSSQAASIPKGFSILGGIEYGSFGRQHTQVGVSWGGDTYTLRIKTFYATSQNDYPYEDKGIRYQLPRAPLYQYGILPEVQLRIGQYQTLFLSLWYQYNDRDIGGSITSANTKANQIDKSMRLLLHWTRVRRRNEIMLKMALGDEGLKYQSSTLSAPSSSRTQSLITEAEYVYSLPYQQSVRVGMNLTNYYVRTNNYTNNQNQVRGTLVASYLIDKKLFTINATLKEEAVTNYGLSPIHFSLTSSFKLYKALSTQWSIHKTFRYPTLNDLYWSPGGNQQLQPEQALNYEMALTLHTTTSSKQSYQLSTHLFSNQIQNWIVWLPSGSFSMPKNILSVWSRGIEINATYHCSLPYIEVDVSSNNSFVWSTNEASLSAQLHKTLLYVPFWTHTSILTTRYRKSLASLSYHWTDKRYTDEDNLQAVGAYHTLDLSLEQSFRVRAYNFDMYLKLYNLTQTNYMVIAFYPQPLFHFQLGVRVRY